MGGKDGGEPVKMVLDDSIVANTVANQPVSRCPMDEGHEQTQEQEGGKGQTFRWERA
jgi:hypothetical protein